MVTKQERQERIKINDKCVGQMLTLLDSTGLSPYEKLSIFNRFRWYIVVVVSGFIFMGLIAFTVHHRHNLNVILGSVAIGLSLFCVTLKGACFKWYRNNLITINNILSEMMEDQMTAKDDVWEILIDSMSYFAKTLYPTITCLGFSMLVLMWSRPTLTMLISYLKGNMTYARFYPTLYFWTITPGSWTWIVHFSIELLYSWYVVSIGITTDNMYSYIISKIIGHFRTLNYEIKNLQFHEIEMSKIKSFHMRHQQLNIICKLFGEFVGPFVLVIVLSTAVILCTTIFQISQMEQITFSKLIWPLVYTLYKLLQIFIYSWGGELIKTESEKFRDAVYFSAWTDAKNNKLVSHSVRMMMHQRPIILKACQIKPITAELFSGLINTTLSYFFLLQTINEKS